MEAAVLDRERGAQREILGEAEILLAVATAGADEDEVDRADDAPVRGERDGDHRRGQPLAPICRGWRLLALVEQADGAPVGDLRHGNPGDLGERLLVVE